METRMCFDQWKRRDFIALLGMAAALPLGVRAQSGRARRVGLLLTLDANDPEGEAELKALKAAFEKLGWVDGSNLQARSQVVRRPAEPHSGVGKRAG